MNCFIPQSFEIHFAYSHIDSVHMKFKDIEEFTLNYQADERAKSWLSDWTNIFDFSNEE